MSKKRSAELGWLVVMEVHVKSFCWVTTHGLKIKRYCSRLPQLASYVQQLTSRLAVTTTVVYYGTVDSPDSYDRDSQWPEAADNK